MFEESEGRQRDEGVEGGMKGYTAATSHSVHDLTASSPAPGSRSVEEEGEGRAPAGV